jgi:hypothetical protein
MAERRSGVWSSSTRTWNPSGQRSAMAVWSSVSSSASRIELLLTSTRRFNKERDDFASEREYNDYLEMVEDISEFIATIIDTS